MYRLLSSPHRHIPHPPSPPPWQMPRAPPPAPPPASPAQRLCRPSSPGRPSRGCRWRTPGGAWGGRRAAARPRTGPAAALRLGSSGAEGWGGWGWAAGGISGQPLGHGSGCGLWLKLQEVPRLVGRLNPSQHVRRDAGQGGEEWLLTCQAGVPWLGSVSAAAWSVHTDCKTHRQVEPACFFNRLKTRKWSQRVNFHSRRASGAKGTHLCQGQHQGPGLSWGAPRKAGVRQQAPASAQCCGRSGGGYSLHWLAGGRERARERGARCIVVQHCCMGLASE